MVSTRILVCSSTACLAVGAQAFSLAFPYGGGHSNSAIGSDSYAAVTDPVHVNSGSSEAMNAFNRLQTLFPTANVTTAGDLSGVMSFDTLLAGTVPRGGGAQWDARFNTTQDLSSTYLCVIQTTVVNGGAPSYSFIFRNVSGDASPHFYNVADEAPHRNSSDSFGPYAYRYENFLFSFITGTNPYWMSKTWSAFFIDDTTISGTRNFTIHDGVTFSTTFGSPVPEPVTVLALGAGALLMRRRRR